MATAEPLLTRGHVPEDSFAVRLRVLRIDVGRLENRPPASVEEMAERCGIKTATWSTWENGAMPRNMVSAVRKIAAATGYDLEWLMWGGPLIPAIGYMSNTAGSPPVLTAIEGKRRGPAPRGLRFLASVD